MVAPLKLGIAGLGTVGAEVVRLIETQARVLAGRSGRGIRVVAVTARSKAKKRSVDLRGVEWVKDPLALATHPGIDCFVELMGGAGDPALGAVEAALNAGKSVVTANKALLAKHGLKLAKAAEKHGGALNFEAAVGAAIPVIKTLREGLAGTGISRVYGILNGTCNYILTRMEQEGLSFAECLKDAQRLGYAEANPSFDVDGHDTAQKLAILASLAFGTKVAQSAVYVEGISSIAPEDLRAAADLGYRVKLLGVAVRTATGIEQRVHPTMVPKSSSIAQVMGVTNAVTIDGEGIPPITLVGPGAGEQRPRPPWWPTSPTLRAASAPIRSAGRSRSCATPGRRRWSATRAATTSASWRAISLARRPRSRPGSPSRRFRSSRSCSVIPMAGSRRQMARRCPCPSF